MKNIYVLLAGILSVASVQAAQVETFNKESLGKLAAKSADRLSTSKSDIERNVIAALLKTPVSAKVETVDETATGYTLHIRVGWQIEKRHLADRLKRYFNVMDFDDVEPNPDEPQYEGMDYPDIKELVYSELPLSIWQHRNDNGEGVDPQASELFKYLSQHYVAASITFGAKEILIPVLFTARDCDVGEVLSGEVISGESIICLNSHKATEANIYYNLSNPVSISVSNDDVKDGANLVAKMVLVK